MPVLIIGGESRKPKEKASPFSSMVKHKGGIGGKYSMQDDTSESESPAEGVDTDAKKTEAAKLLLRAIDTKNPRLVAEAITTLVECCSDDGDGADDESDSEDSGEMD